MNNYDAYLKGEGVQFKEAKAVAKVGAENARMYGYRLSYTGHSLGGGLAIVATLATGNRSVVINPAPMTNRLLKYLNLDLRFQDKIYNLVVDGEAIHATGIGFYPGHLKILDRVGFVIKGGTPKISGSYPTDATRLHSLASALASMKHNGQGTEVQ